MLFAVVGNLITLRFDSNLVLIFAVYNRKLTVVRGDVVILVIRTLIESVREGVLNTSGYRYCASNFISSALAADEAVAGYINRAVRQRCAVVLLLGSARGEDYGTLGDVQLASGKGRGSIVVADILTVSIDDRVRPCKASSVLTRIGSLCRRVGDGELVTLAKTVNRVVLGSDGLFVAGNGSGEFTTRLLFAVIFLVNVLDSNGQRCLGYFKCTEGVGNLVVRRLSATPVDCVSVFAFAHGCLRASHVKRDGVAGTKLNGARTCGFSRSPSATHVLIPVAVIKRCTFTLGQRFAVIDLFSRRRCNRQRQRLNREEAVACIYNDRVVRVGHDVGTADSDASNDCLLLIASNRIGTSVLLGNQCAIGAVQRAPDSIAILGLKEIPLATGDVYVSGLGCVVIEVLLVRIGEANIERLTRVVVRSCTARVGVPLVSSDADVHARRLHGQRTRNIDDAVVRLWVGDCLGALGDLGVLRGGSARTGIRLRSIKLD